jgi:RHS repeat-associated protein
MAVPVPERITRTTPGGRTLTVTTRRQAALATPGNPLSLIGLFDTTTVNGRSFTSNYDAATRTQTSTSAANRQTVATLDSRGRVISKRLAPTLAPATVTYDARGRITSLGQGTQSFTFAYDSSDRIISRTDATGRQTQYAWDAADRLTQTTLPSGRTYRFTYDANGNRTQVQMPNGGAHAFTYTPLDSEASYTPPGNGSFLRIYEADRALARLTLPSGREVQSTYDANGRNSGFTFPEATINVAYSTNDLTERPALIGRAPTATGANQELQLGYDGDLVTSTNWNGAASGQYTYTYDNDFLLTAAQLVSGANTVQTAFTRDAEGLITGYGPFTFTRGGPAGALSQVRDANLDASYTYDTMGRITRRTQTVAGQTSYDAQFTYDALGQITRKVETVGGINSTYDYGYDADGQLLQVSRGGTVIEQYAYDVNGNRSSRQLGTAATEAATYDGQDRLTQRGSTTYQFNEDGFLAQRGADTFNYSARGELLQATVGGQIVTYSYDGVGRRTARTTVAGTTQYLYGDPLNVMLPTAVRDGAGVLTTLYYDDAGLLVALERGGSRFYVATDQVGTPRRVTDATGQALKVLEYDAFGNLVADSAPAFDLPIGFAGGLVDPLTGLTRFGFRDYDPAAGRWMARDPVGFEGGQGNLYAYADGDPINLRDPLGLWCVGASGYVGIGGGAKLCCTWKGCSVCAEVGFGLGAKVQAGSGGLDRTGAKAGLEISAKCGPAGVGIGASIDDRGCTELEAQTEIGLERLKGLSAGTEGEKVGASIGLDGAERKLGLGCSAQGKVAATLCKGR